MTFGVQNYSFNLNYNNSSGAGVSAYRPSYPPSQGANPMQKLQGMALIFAGMDLIDDGQINGSILKKILGGQPQPAQQQPIQPQGNYAAAQAGPNGAYAQAGPAPNQQQAQNPQQQNMMLMMMQMMMMLMQMMMQMMGQGQPQPQSQPFPFAQAGNGNNYAQSGVGPNGLPFAMAGSGL